LATIQDSTIALILIPNRIQSNRNGYKIPIRRKFDNRSSFDANFKPVLIFTKNLKLLKYWRFLFFSSCEHLWWSS